ncbi:plasmid replication protein RepC [Terrarubrum flagellatum]|uniref:plasmid replication protein RepC n=1 Tax=Terrirubrum flagellatum TaxID=2895980 RepID=UPI0031454374
MTDHLATTPFGRRPVTLGQIAARLNADAAIAEAANPGSNRPTAVHKWKLFRAITEARVEIGVSDRALAVLNALLTFHPETALSLPAGEGEGIETEGEGGPNAATALVVFPSNRELSLRAHGLGERSIARHLASLVEAGLIIRRDSPNGKRYARRARGSGEGFAEAFGFDLTPLVARAGEFESIAEQLRREHQRMRVLRERISLHRRDIAKMIACGLEEGGEGAGDWDRFAAELLAFAGPLRRVHDAASLERIESGLGELRRAVTAAVSELARRDNETRRERPGRSASDSGQESGNAGSDVSHLSNSNTQPPDLEPASKEAWGEIQPPDADPESGTTPAAKHRDDPPPLGLVLDACPDIGDWAPDGIRRWSDFLAAARLLRPALGVSPSAWTEAVDILGETNAAIALAAILQRHESSSDAVSTPVTDGGPPRVTVHGSPAIRSAGGYLRVLTEQASAGDFSISPLLMALIGQRMKAKRRKIGGPAGEDSPSRR